MNQLISFEKHLRVLYVNVHCKIKVPVLPFFELPIVFLVHDMTKRINNFFKPLACFW